MQMQRRKRSRAQLPVAALALAILLTVGACGRDVPDADVTRRVSQNLERSPDLAAYDLDVATENGHVTLSGRVAEEAQRSEAERIARATPDVEDVVNRIQTGGALPETAPPAVGAPPPATQPE
jgi:osmotically-inducible protein OsmY